MKHQVLNVFGQKVPIVKAPIQKESNIMGFYEFDKKQITIDTSLSKEDEIHTIIHEAMHSLSHRMGWNQIIVPQVEELMCEHISTVLCENFDIKLKK